MADKTYEVAFWLASEAYQKDPTIIDTALQFVRNAKGSHEIFDGLQTGATPNTILTIAWDSLAAHQEFIANKENYLVFFHKLGVTFADGQITLRHTHLPTDPLPLFKAGLTDFNWITPKEGAKDEVIALVEKIVALANDPSSIAIGAAYGTLVEDPETILLVSGWASQEDKDKVLATTPLKRVIDEIVSKSDGRVDSVSLRISPLKVT